MSGQNREVILRRLLVIIELLLVNKGGLTIKEITRKVRERDADLGCNERTIRRDCLTFERMGWVEPRDEFSERRGIAWRVRATNGVEGWFQKPIRSQEKK